MAKSATYDRVTRKGSVSVGRQALRREVNGRIRARVELSESVTFEAFCECGRVGCTERIRVRALSYDVLRRVPTHFLVKRGHAEDADRIAAEHGEFVVVEKFGRSGVEAVALERGRKEL